MQRGIPVDNDLQQLRVSVQPYPCVARRILADDVGRTVRAPVVEQDVLPVLVGLREDAVDALAKMALPVVDGCHDPD